MSDKHVLGFRLTFLRRFWDFLMIYALLSQDFDVEIYALLSRDFDVEIYALFLQIFRDWKTDSANSFAFRMCDRRNRKDKKLYFFYKIVFCYAYSVYLSYCWKFVKNPWHCFVGSDNGGTLVPISLAWLSINRRRHCKQGREKRTIDERCEVSGPKNGILRT